MQRWAVGASCIVSWFHGRLRLFESIGRWIFHPSRNASWPKNHQPLHRYPIPLVALRYHLNATYEFMNWRPNSCFTLCFFLNSQTFLGVLKVNSIVYELVWYRSCCYPWQYYDTTWMLLMNEWIGDPTAALLTLFLKWSKSFGYFKSYWVGLLPVATATTWLVQRCYFECYSASCYWFVCLFFFMF